MLFDLDSDPHERKNLFSSEEHRGRIRELAQKIRTWQEQIGDQLVLPEV